MIIIPEIETVVILTPRTGSKSLRLALAERYPRSILLYRHMEADGVPAGYDRWRRIGVVRHPVDRLWSLYRYLKWMGGKQDGLGKWEPAYVARQRQCAELPFSEWLVANNVVFTSPYDSALGDRFYPGFTVRHALPENRKSQYVYLRPDLGTIVWPFAEIDQLHSLLGIEPGRENANASAPAPTLSAEALEHMDRFFAWDYAAAGRRSPSLEIAA